MPGTGSQYPLAVRSSGVTELFLASMEAAAILGAGRGGKFASAKECRTEASCGFIELDGAVGRWKGATSPE